MTKLTEQELAKLALDAENILTWATPPEGDPLIFAHLRRFSAATARMVSELRALRRVAEAARELSALALSSFGVANPDVVGKKFDALRSLRDALAAWERGE